MTRIVLDTNVMGSFEITAVLEVLTCYPAASPSRARALEARLCAEWIDANIDQRMRQYDHPKYRLSNNRVSTAKINFYREHALRAGYVMLAEIQLAATGAPPRFGSEAEGRMPSEREMILRAFSLIPGNKADLSEDEIKDFRRRQVRQRAPVAHLVAAFANQAMAKFSRGESLVYEYGNLDFLRETIDIATQMAVHIRAAPRLSWAADKLIDFEWRDG